MIVPLERIHDSPRRPASVRQLLPVLAAACVWWAVAPAAAQVKVLVSHVGFPTSGGDAVRVGAWAPVTVDLEYEGAGTFDGTLRIGHRDIDGDVAFDSVPVHLGGDATSIRRYLYLLPNPMQLRSPPVVELYNESGDLVDVDCGGTIAKQCGSGAPPFAIADDDLLILSVSDGSRGKIDTLTDTSSHFARRPWISHIAPANLPEHWVGLEAVDFLVWDEADPDRVSPKQLEAVLEWVRQGGVLLIAASRTGGKIAASPTLQAVLPVEIGEVAASDEFPQLRRELLEERESARGFYHERIAYVAATLRPGAELVHLEPGLKLPLISRQPLGSGSVIFCGATLRDVFGDTGSPRAFFASVLRLKIGAQQSAQAGSAEPVSLFDEVAASVGFSTGGGTYFVIAMIFSIGYIVLATVGVWAFLRSKGWKHHNWSAFALIGIAASLLSLAAVRSVQGVGYKVHQLSVIDVASGDNYARGTAYFGIKTPTDTSLDLWMPTNAAMDRERGPSRCFLRPLPVGGDPVGFREFADRDEYRLMPASAGVDDVRVRGTLKRLEGRWEGPLGGSFTSSVRIVDGGTGRFDRRITDDSFIVNDLGVTLRDCWVLHAFYSSNDAVAERSDNIYAFRVGRSLPSDGKKVPLADLCYGMTRPDMAKFLTESKLKDRHKDWSNLFIRRFLPQAVGPAPSVREQDFQALLLASTAGDYDPLAFAEDNTFGFVGPKTVSQDRLRQYDLRDRLQPDSLYLIGFADDPGPIRLAARVTGDEEFRLIEPVTGHGRVMYRIRLPAIVEDGGGASAKALAPRAGAAKDAPENPEESDDPETVAKRGIDRLNEKKNDNQ
jgi:hypothetical protein